MRTPFTKEPEKTETTPASWELALDRSRDATLQEVETALADVHRQLLPADRKLSALKDERRVTVVHGTEAELAELDQQIEDAGRSLERWTAIQGRLKELQGYARREEQEKRAEEVIPQIPSRIEAVERAQRQLHMALQALRETSSAVMAVNAIARVDPEIRKRAEGLLGEPFGRRTAGMGVTL